MKYKNEENELNKKKTKNNKKSKIIKKTLFLPIVIGNFLLKKARILKELR